MALVILLLAGVGAASAKEITIHSVGLGEATIARGDGHSWVWYVMDGSDATVEFYVGEIMHLQDITSHGDYTFSRICSNPECSDYVSKADPTTIEISSFDEYWVIFIPTYPINASDYNTIDILLSGTDAGTASMIGSIAISPTLVESSIWDAYGTTAKRWMVPLYDIQVVTSNYWVYNPNMGGSFANTICHEIGHVQAYYDGYAVNHTYAENEIYANNYADLRGC